MNISEFNDLTTNSGWKLIRILNSSYQYLNVTSGERITVTISDISNISEDVTRTLKSKIQFLCT